MRKAIRLQVTLWIEGEAAPTDDFFEAASRAIRDVIAAGNTAHPELRFTVKHIAEDTGS
jgi:hypothetical protein